MSSSNHNGLHKSPSTFSEGNNKISIGENLTKTYYEIESYANKLYDCRIIINDELEQFYDFEHSIAKLSKYGFNINETLYNNLTFTVTKTKRTGDWMGGYYKTTNNLGERIQDIINLFNEFKTFEFEITPRFYNNTDEFRIHKIYYENITTGKVTNNTFLCDMNEIINQIKNNSQINISSIKKLLNVIKLYIGYILNRLDDIYRKEMGYPGIYYRNRPDSPSM